MHRTERQRHQRQIMFEQHYPPMVIAYVIGLTGWLAANRLWPQVWPRGPVKSFENPWTEFGIALAGAVGVIAVGQLWSNNLLVTEEGALRPVLASINQGLTSRRSSSYRPFVANRGRRRGFLRSGSLREFFWDSYWRLARSPPTPCCETALTHPGTWSAESGVTKTSTKWCRWFSKT